MEDALSPVGKTLVTWLVQGHLLVLVMSWWGPGPGQSPCTS